MARNPPPRSSTPTSRRAPAFTAAWVAVALGASACGSDDGNEGAFEELFVAAYPGGLGGAPASAESTCDPLAYRDTLAVDSAYRQLSSDSCHFEPPDLYTLRRGQRGLTLEEFGSVEQTFAQIKAGTAEWMCGADAGFLTLDVRIDGGSVASYISSSSCPAESSAGRTPATGIGALWSKLDELSAE